MPWIINSAASRLARRKQTLPPSTSSPMIRHAAVCIVLAKFWSAVEEAMMPAASRAPFEVTGVLQVNSADGLDRGRANLDNRANIKSAQVMFDTQSREGPSMLEHEKTPDQKHINRTTV